jgi:hypothetical protein
MDANPTGCYRTSFTLPDAWREAAEMAGESAFLIWDDLIASEIASPLIASPLIAMG